jgi:hydrogenase maturation protease
VKNILIGGMGNVLLGDDAFGPYVVHLLETQFRFEEGVQVEDLGTPALDLTHRIAEQYAVILIDCISIDEYPAGTVLAYDKADLLSAIPAQRLDPHSPAVSECLLAAEMLGKSPENVLLVGVVGECFDPGEPLSEAVRGAVDKVIGAVLGELWRLGVTVDRKASSPDSGEWWAEEMCVPAGENLVH